MPRRVLALLAPVCAGGTAVILAAVAHFEGPAAAVNVTGSGVVDGDSGRISLTVSGQGVPEQKGEELYALDGGHHVLYLRFPALTKQLPTGKTWLKVDLERAAKKAGLDLGSLGGDQNPADSLAMLRGSSDKVEKVGSETIGGVATTHYHAAVDLEKAAAQKGVSSSSIRKLIKLIGSKTIPADVWVDGDGFVRRLRESYAVTSPKGKVQTTLTMDLSDYGTSVSVSPPPADQVLDALKLAPPSSASKS